METDQNSVLTLRPGTYWLTVTDNSNGHDFGLRSARHGDPLRPELRWRRGRSRPSTTVRLRSLQRRSSSTCRRHLSVVLQRPRENRRHPRDGRDARRPRGRRGGSNRRHVDRFACYGARARLRPLGAAGGSRRATPRWRESLSVSCRPRERERRGAATRRSRARPGPIVTVASPGST